MFEFSIVAKYLIPRRKQLSVSIISLISIAVISLVVWLIVVFFSVTHGLERLWTNKLITLTAPVRITPTDDYFQSYYYQIDQWSADSHFSPQTIQEKKDFFAGDPYDPEVDQELPATFPAPDLDDHGQLKDLIGGLFSSIENIRGFSDLSTEEFETTLSEINLQLIRPQDSAMEAVSTIKQPSFLSTFSEENPTLSQSILPLRAEDIQNVLLLLGSDGEEAVSQETFHDRYRLFAEHATIREFRAPAGGWPIPLSWLQANAFTAPAASSDQKIFVFPNEQARTTWLNQHTEATKGTLDVTEGVAYWNGAPTKQPLILAEGTTLKGSLPPETTALHPRLLTLPLELTINQQKLTGSTPLGTLEVASATTDTAQTPFWLHQENGLWTLPEEPGWGEGVLLPRAFREAGARVGDRGFFKYYAPGATSVQEQQLPVFIAGFYDPGIIPLGGKWALANRETVSLIGSSQNSQGHPLSNGLYLRFNNYQEADKVKNQLVSSLQKQGLTPYWKVETFREYDFAKELIQQLGSEKNLFSLLATVIIVVACSNIISMLIILVNDKRMEIGILRSLGAKSSSMILIFGSCGLLMGTIGSILGTLVALLTLANLESLIHGLSFLQGHEMFQTAIYGEHLPNQVSPSAIVFVFATTMLISLLAGLVPAAKACRIRPAAILKQE